MEAKPLLVGDLAVPFGLFPVKVEAVGLVTGLHGTGSDPEPSPQRSMLMEEMQRRGVKNPNALLASRDVSLVMVRGILRPGMQKGDRFDVEVRIPGRSETTSLRGGYLLETRLTDMACSANPAIAGREDAGDGRRAGAGRSVGLGDGEERPRAAGAGAGAGRRRRPRVRDRWACMIIKSEAGSASMTPEQLREAAVNSAQVANAINRRFHTFKNGIQVGRGHGQDRQIRRPERRSPLQGQHRALHAGGAGGRRCGRSASETQTSGWPAWRSSCSIRPLRPRPPSAVGGHRHHGRRDVAEGDQVAGTRGAVQRGRGAGLSGPAGGGRAAGRGRPAGAGLPGLSPDRPERHGGLRRRRAAPRSAGRAQRRNPLRGLPRPVDDQSRRPADARRVPGRAVQLPRAGYAGPPHDPRHPQPPGGGRPVRAGPAVPHAPGASTPATGSWSPAPAPSRSPSASSRRPNGDQKRVVSTRVDEVLRAIVELGGTYPDVVQALQEAKAGGALEGRFEVEALPEGGRNYQRPEHAAGCGGEIAAASRRRRQFRRPEAVRASSLWYNDPVQRSHLAPRDGPCICGAR